MISVVVRGAILAPITTTSCSWCTHDGWTGRHPREAGLEVRAPENLRCYKELRLDETVNETVNRMNSQSLFCFILCVHVYNAGEMQCAVYFW